MPRESDGPSAKEVGIDRPEEAGLKEGIKGPESGAEQAEVPENEGPDEFKIAEKGQEAWEDADQTLKGLEYKIDGLKKEKWDIEKKKSELQPSSQLGRGKDWVNEHKVVLNVKLESLALQIKEAQDRYNKLKPEVKKLEEEQDATYTDLIMRALKDEKGSIALEVGASNFLISKNHVGTFSVSLHMPNYDFGKTKRANEGKLMRFHGVSAYGESTFRDVSQEALGSIIRSNGGIDNFILKLKDSTRGYKKTTFKEHFRSEQANEEA